MQPVTGYSPQRTLLVKYDCLTQSPPAGKWKPNDYPFVDNVRAIYLTLEKLIQPEETQVNGIVILADYTGVGMSQASNPGPFLAKKVVSILQVWNSPSYDVFCTDTAENMSNWVVNPEKTDLQQWLLSTACWVLYWLWVKFTQANKTRSKTFDKNQLWLFCLSFYSQDGFPIRIKAVNIINEPRIFKGIFAIIKPFLKEKMAERVTIVFNSVVFELSASLLYTAPK